MAETAEEIAAREAAEAEAAAASADGAGDGAAEKTLKQSEVDAIVESRLARERKKFADYDELKSKAQKFEEAEAAKLSELERETAARVAAEARAAELEARVTADRVKSAIAEAGRELGVNNVKLLQAAVDATGVTVGDDGQVTGASEAVKAAVAENPELVGAKGNSGSADQGARGGGPDAITQEQFDALPMEQRAKLLKEGKINHLL